MVSSSVCLCKLGIISSCSWSHPRQASEQPCKADWQAGFATACQSALQTEVERFAGQAWALLGTWQSRAMQ